MSETKKSPKRFQFKNTNSFAASEETQKKALFLINKLTEKPEDYPATTREVFELLVNELSTVMETDQATKIKYLEKVILQKNDEITALDNKISDQSASLKLAKQNQGTVATEYEEKIQSLQKDLEAARFDTEAVKQAAINYQSQDHVVEFDEESWEIVKPFLEEYRALDPEATIAQALADYHTLVASLKKHYSIEGRIKLRNGQRMAF